MPRRGEEPQDAADSESGSDSPQFAQQQASSRKSLSGLQLTLADDAGRVAWVRRYRELLSAPRPNITSAPDVAKPSLPAKVEVTVTDTDMKMRKTMPALIVPDMITVVDSMEQDSAARRVSPNAANSKSLNQEEPHATSHKTRHTVASVHHVGARPVSPRDEAVIQAAEEVRVQAEVGRLKRELITEKNRHRKAQEKLHQLEGKMLEMHAAVLAVSPKKHIGGSGAAIYGELLPMPRVTPRKPRGVCLSPLKVIKTSSGSASPVSAMSPQRSAPNFFRPSESDDDDTGSLRGKNRAERSKTRLQLIAKRQRSTASTWELRRAEKTDKMNTVYHFGENMWNSFHDWKETSHYAV